MTNLARVKRNWWMICLTLALIAALAGVVFWYHPEKKRREFEQTQVAAALTGDANAVATLRKLGKNGVRLVEDFIEKEYRVDSAQIARDVAKMGSPDPKERLLATARLTLLPERANDLLKAHWASQQREDLKESLKNLMARRPKAHKLIGSFLTGLYSENLNKLFVERRDRFQKKHNDIPSQLFFAYAPFKETWMMLRQSPREVQIRYLLLRFYCERDGESVDYLQEISAAEILREAAATWWPVELDPPAKDGALMWTTRAAAVQGNIAVHPFRMAIRPSSQPGLPEEWAFLDRWLCWSYIFSLKTPVLNKDCVVYSELESRKVNLHRRVGPNDHRERVEEKFWLPESNDKQLIGPGRSEMIRGLAPGARIPIVVLSREEGTMWYNGKVFDWSKPLFNRTMQAYLRFEANKFPVPQVFADAEQAAKEAKKSRARRK